MLSIKIFLTQLCLIWPKMLEDVPAHAYGTYNRYIFWAPMKITVAVMLIFIIIYLILFKFTWSRRRWLIAYLRFFTGKKKMIEVVDSSYTIIFTIIAGLLYHPYFFAHRAFLADDQERFEQFYGYVLRWANKQLKKKLKNKKKVNTFWKSIAYHAGQFALEIPKETYQELYYYDENYWEFDIYDIIETWDHCEEGIFISNSEFHNLLYAHFYLFSELSLKTQLRGAIFDSFKAKSKITGAEEVDELVELFYANYVKRYVPTSIWWHAAARNASTFASDVRYNPKVLRVMDRLPSLFQMRAEYYYYLGYLYPHTYSGEVGFNDDDTTPDKARSDTRYFNKLSDLWAKLYKKIYGQELEEFLDFPRRERWSDLPSMEEYNRLITTKMVSWYRLEKHWRFRRPRFLRFHMYLKYFPIGADTSYSNVSADIFYFQVEKTSRQHHYQLLPSDLVFYKDAVTPGGSWTWKHRRATPAWHRWYWRKWDKKLKKMRIWNREGKEIVNYWRITQEFFIRYHRRNPYGFFKTTSKYHYPRWGDWRLISPIIRARDFYFLLYFNHIMDDADILSENPKEWKMPSPVESEWFLPNSDMFSDGYGPLYSMFNYYSHFWFRAKIVAFSNPTDVFDEWAPMSDSNFAHNITKFDPNTPGNYYISIYSDPVVERQFANSFFDFAYEKQLGFQDPATPSMEGIIDLHHDLMFFLTIIIIFVLWLLVSVVYNFYFFNNKYEEVKNLTIVPSLKSHNVVLEIVWTVVPSLILLLIALPSFALIYSMDELISPRLTLKVIGHQWYWSYEYNHPVSATASAKISKISDLSPDVSFQKIFDSNMILEEDLKKGQLRLLEVNKRTYLPKETNLRILVTSADVLHSWAVPSLGVKVDACPGRLNQTPLYIKRLGTFYGQCSEICGVNHAFMPIVVQAVTPGDYVKWFARSYDIKSI